MELSTICDRFFSRTQSFKHGAPLALVALISACSSKSHGSGNTGGQATCTQGDCGGASASGGSGKDASANSTTQVSGCHGIMSDSDAGACPGTSVRQRFEIALPDSGYPTTVPCEIPFSGNLPTGGARYSLTEARLVLTYPSGVDELFSFIPSSTDCNDSHGGFSYDNANSPTMLILCSCTCAQFNGISVVPQIEVCTQRLGG